MADTLPPLKILMRQGIAELAKAWWTFSEDTALPKDVLGETLVYYGKDEHPSGKPTPITCHIRVRDLFITNQYHLAPDDKIKKIVRRLHKGSKLVIDLFTLPKEDFQAVCAVNDLKEADKIANDKTEYIGTLSLDLGTIGYENEYDQPKGSEQFLINEEHDTTIDLKVTNPEDGQSIEETGTAVQVKLKTPGGSVISPLVDIGFEIPFTEEMEKILFTLGEQGKSVFGWAWMINTTTCKDYQAELAKDIKDPEQRIDILKNPDTAEAKGKGVLGIKRYTVGKNLKSLWGFAESLAEKAGNFIVENDFTGLAEKGLDKVTEIADHISGSYAQSRNDNASDGDGFNASDSLGITPDAYPYDEPFLNALHFKRKSPFTGFHLGRQPSAIGLCANSKELYEASYNKKHNHYFSIERGDPSTFESANEMFIRSEPRFFLKEKSAPLWLNSIECEFGAAQGSYSKGNYPFGSGKDSHTFITSHDFMAKIEWVASSMMAGKIAGYYTAQNTIAFDGFESITVLEGDLKQDGQTVGKVGKGYPVSGTERFIGTCHNKVTLQSKQTNAFEQYQAHAINHRPLMIMFALERDLSDREKDLMASAPLKIEFQFYNFTLNDLHSVTYEIPLDDTYTTKGAHLLLLYPIFHTNVKKLKMAGYCGVTLGTGNTLVEIDNRKVKGDRIGNKEYWVREIHLSNHHLSLDNEFVTYKPSGDGLFSGCPVITAEDFYPQEVADNQVSKAVDDYILNTRKEAAKFLTGLIPTWGGVASGIVDLLFGFLKDKKWNGAGAVGSLNSVVSTFITEYLGKKKASETIKNFTGKCLSSSAAAASAVAFIAAIEKEKKDLDDKVTLVTNPFLQGVKFGEDQTAFDSIYLLSVTEIKRCVVNGSFTVKTTDNTAMFFMNRQVDKITNQQGFAPFQYQFSPTGGFLERDSYSEGDSLFCGNMLGDFYSKLKSFKEKFSKELKDMSGGKMKAGDFSKLIVKQGMLKQIFSNKNVNPDLVEYVGKDKIPKLVDKYMINQKEFASDQERIEFDAFRRLMGYLSAMYPRCPVCNSAVSMSWGWCPFHGTNDILLLVDRDGKGEKGTLRDEFIFQYGEESLGSYLEEEDNKKRILVHWTEFLIS